MAKDERTLGIRPADCARVLETLMHSVYLEIARRPVRLGALKQPLVALLSFLASPEGRTNHNCRAVDTFFCIRDDWEVGWDHLPVAFQRILEDLGGALHDTVSSPAIAERFGSTPEELLNRVRRIIVREDGATRG